MKRRRAWPPMRPPSSDAAPTTLLHARTTTERDGFDSEELLPAAPHAGPRRLEDRLTH